MKRLVIFTILVCISAAVITAQTPSRVPSKIAPRSVPFKNVTEVSNEDWIALAAALEKEDWKQSATLAAGHLLSLKTENDKKQLAQLRYIYLFSLGGQILGFNARGNAVEAEKTWMEVDKAMANFINKEIVMPPRPFTTDCTKKLNVVCQVKESPNAFRTTATNKEGSGIHSFDYVQLDQPLDIKEFNNKEVFIGGILRRAEYNEDKSKPWVLRLFVNNGFLRVVIK